MITTIIFDWAGVLTTGKYTQSILDELKKKKNISIEAIYERFDILIMEMMRGNLTFFEFISKVNDDFNLGTNKEELTDIFNKAIHPNYATIEFAKTLKPYYKLAILSDNDAVTVENLKNHYSEMFNLFEKKYFSFELGTTKPDPNFFEYAMQDLNVKASECLFIDDKVKNVDVAKQLGMNAIQFIDIKQLKDDFANRGISQRHCLSS